VDSEIFESQFQELAVDPGSSPGGILGRQGPDEIAKLEGDFRSTETTARKEAPVAAEPGAMPADDSLRLHDYQQVRPSRPPTPEAQPEQAIPRTQLRSGFLTLEDADLLSQGDELQSEVMSGAEEGTEPRKKRQEKRDHEPSLHEAVGREAGSCKSLISQGNRILATHRVKTLGAVCQRRDRLNIRMRLGTASARTRTDLTRLQHDRSPLLVLRSLAFPRDAVRRAMAKALAK
jgi:hypothetical protein